MIERPWGVDNAYEPYSVTDNRMIGEALSQMIAGKIRLNNILVPLELTKFGTQYYVYISREEFGGRAFELSQVRNEFNGRNTHIRERPVRVLGLGLQHELSHLTFGSTPIGADIFEKVFWNMLNEQSAKMFNTVSLSTNKHTPTHRLTFRSDSRTNGGWARYPAPVPVVSAFPYDDKTMANIEIGFLAICSPESGPTSMMMIPLIDENRRYVAIRREGQVLTVSDVDFKEYGIVDEAVFIFPREMETSFPGFQFASAKLTDAEKQVLVQKPVFDRYTEMFEPYVTRYRYNARMALLSCLHPRVVEKVKISILGVDLLKALAKMSL